MYDLMTMSATTTMARREYHDVRNEMRTGDVIAFGGSSIISRLTKRVSGSNVSHVAIVVQTRLRDEEGDRFDNLIIESTKRGGYFGVIVSPASEVIKRYVGDVWWLPLQQKPESRNNADLADFLYRHPKDTSNRRVFDFFGGALALFDCLDNVEGRLKGITYTPEELSKFFCSELVAHGLEHAGILQVDNASEISPIDLCRLHIYKPEYFQLKGEPREIERFNSGKLKEDEGDTRERRARRRVRRLNRIFGHRLAEPKPRPSRERAQFRSG
jgi:hypothetical protein